MIDRARGRARRPRVPRGRASHPSPGRNSPCPCRHARSAASPRRARRSPRAARGRRHAALGRSRRHADDRPALAERESHQQHQRASSTSRSSIRDKKLRLAPALAESWTQVNPTTWRFKLRPGVKFHDGTPFTADDVVFSFERARADTSQLRVYATASGMPRKVDDLTVDFDDHRPEPDRARARRQHQHHEQGVVREEPRGEAAELHAEGGHDHGARTPTAPGPYALKSREPDVKTVLTKNPNWWGIKDGRFEGNVDERRLHADRLRRDARRRAHLRRSRPRQRPAAAGRAAPDADARDQGARRHREPHRVHRHGPGPRRAPVLERQGQEPVQGQARARRRSTRRSTSRRSSKTTMRGLSQPTGAILPSPVHDHARDREAAAVRQANARRSCWPRPATRTASR